MGTIKIQMNRETYDKVMAYLAENGGGADSDFLEMHFEIPMQEDDSMGFQVGYVGELEGDYTKDFNKLKDFYDKNKIDGIVPEEVMIEKSNITVNGYTAIGMEYVDNTSINDEILVRTNAPMFPGGSNELIVTPTRLYFECSGSPTAPDAGGDEVIEYHFEIPMNDYGIMGASGSIDGDFSNIFNKLITFTRTNGSPSDGFDKVVLAEDIEGKVNVTVNGDKIIRMHDEGDVIFFVTEASGPMGGGWDGNASGNLYATSISYERGA